MTDTTVEAPATPRLKQKYNEQIVPELEKEFHYSNPMQVARVQKVVVSMGVGAAARDSKLIEGAVKDLTLITGQKPKITKAKKSVAQFHLREGQAIGAYVTLRGERMWEFLDRLLMATGFMPISSRVSILLSRYSSTLCSVSDSFAAE